MTQLPDAENRLRICEQNFKNSYGENLDRVVTLKGNAINEKALIMRLHLLQAILRFHRNERIEAQRLLSIAETELAQLQVDEASVTTLVEMGNIFGVHARTMYKANGIIFPLSRIFCDRGSNRTESLFQ